MKAGFGDVAAVSFDGDGTLWDFEAAMWPALDDAALALRDLGLSDGARPVTARLLKDVRDEVAAREQWRHGSMEDIRLASFEEVFARCGSSSGADVRRVYDLYMTARRTYLRPYPDAVGTLEALAGTFLLAVVTNGNTHPADAGLPPVFSTVVSSNDVQLFKPDARIYSLAAERLGVEPARCVHVGDSLVEDVRPARTVSMRTILVDRSGRSEAPAEADATVTTLTSVPALLGL